MQKLAAEKYHRIVYLRRHGNSIPEIAQKVGAGITTIQRYVRGIEVLPEFRTLLREKQGGSKERAEGLRQNMSLHAAEKIGELTERDLFILLIGLYWGEGTKRDFSVINSDPLLIQAFLACLTSFGIPKHRLAISLRVHSDISIDRAKNFWAQVTGLSKKRISAIEIIEGRKKGKLPFGMCRIRVTSGIRERLLIQSSIARIGAECSKRVSSARSRHSSMDRTRGS